MIDLGLVMLVQQALAGSPPVNNVPGGWKGMLPKDIVGSTPVGSSSMIRSAWIYKTKDTKPTYHLTGQDGFTGFTFVIECHGLLASDADALASAIYFVFEDIWSGVLPDPDKTVVQGIFLTDEVSGEFADNTRTFVHTLEYLVNYNQV